VSKKKLLILSSFGGYGHIAAASTIKKLSSNEYEIDVIYPIKELRLYKVPCGESLYNYALSKNWNRFTNIVVRTIPEKVFQNREEKTCQLIQKHIDEKNPDLVISLIPFINYPASEAARRCGIPYLLVTTDNDLHNWVYRLDKQTNPEFRVTIGSNLSTSKGALLEKGIPEEAIETIGLPLRPEFLQSKTKEELRGEYEIPENKSVVLLMMGGEGSRSIYQYAKTLAESPLNAHFVICTGRNGNLANKLKKIEPFPGNSIAIQPFTEKVDEVFALSDLIITKPGPGTINEARSLGLPILIDNIKPPLFWEQANIDMVLSQKIGACIQSMKEVPDLVKKYLYDEQTREEVIRAYKQIPQNKFATEIKQLIDEMCEEPLIGEVAVTSRSYSPNSL